MLLGCHRIACGVGAGDFGRTEDTNQLPARAAVTVHRETRRGLHYCLLLANGYRLAYGVIKLEAGIKIRGFAGGRARVKLWEIWRGKRRARPRSNRR